MRTMTLRALPAATAIGALAASVLTGAQPAARPAGVVPATELSALSCRAIGPAMFAGLSLQSTLPPFAVSPTEFTFPVPMSLFTFVRGHSTIDPDIRTPYVTNWSVGYQRELWRGFVWRRARSYVDSDRRLRHD